jgi:hypothetical protein
MWQVRTQAELLPFVTCGSFIRSAAKSTSYN